MQLYNFFGFLWTVGIVNAMSFMTISFVAVMYYFSTVCPLRLPVVSTAFARSPNPGIDGEAAGGTAALRRRRFGQDSIFTLGGGGNQEGASLEWQNVAQQKCANLCRGS